MTERGTVRLRHAQELADDREWQREGEGRDQIDPGSGSLKSNGIEEVVSDLLHASTQRLERAAVKRRLTRVAAGGCGRAGRP